MHTLLDYQGEEITFHGDFIILEWKHKPEWKIRRRCFVDQSSTIINTPKRQWHSLTYKHLRNWNGQGNSSLSRTQTLWPEGLGEDEILIPQGSKEKRKSHYRMRTSDRARGNHFTSRPKYLFTCYSRFLLGRTTGWWIQDPSLQCIMVCLNLARLATLNTKYRCVYVRSSSLYNFFLHKFYLQNKKWVSISVCTKYGSIQPQSKI